jgi:hypothetical protein
MHFVTLTAPPPRTELMCYLKSTLFYRKGSKAEVSAVCLDCPSAWRDDGLFADEGRILLASPVSCRVCLDVGHVGLWAPVFSFLSSLWLVCSWYR